MRVKMEPKNILNYLVFLLFLFHDGVFAQKKKEIKKQGIKNVVVTQTKEGKTIFDNKTFFDNEGRVSEEINYDSLGQFKSRVKYTRNIKGDVIEELLLDPNGKTLQRNIFKYNKFQQKTEELVYNAENALLLKHSYFYDKTGLKTERKTFSGKGALVSTTYQFAK